MDTCWWWFINSDDFRVAAAAAFVHITIIVVLMLDLKWSDNYKVNIRCWYGNKIADKKERIFIFDSNVERSFQRTTLSDILRTFNKMQISFRQIHWFSGRQKISEDY